MTNHNTPEQRKGNAFIARRDWCYEQIESLPLSVVEGAVLLRMATHKEICFESQTTIGRKIGASRDAVLDACRKLVRHKLIAFKGKRDRVNVYQVLGQRALSANLETQKRPAPVPEKASYGREPHRLRAESPKIIGQRATQTVNRTVKGTSSPLSPPPALEELTPDTTPHQRAGEERGEIIDIQLECTKCGVVAPPDSALPHLCESCAKGSLYTMPEGMR